jgi:hypothetical protein
VLSSWERTVGHHLEAELVKGPPEGVVIERDAGQGGLGVVGADGLEAHGSEGEGHGGEAACLRVQLPAEGRVDQRVAVVPTDRRAVGPE